MGIRDILLNNQTETTDEKKPTRYYSRKQELSVEKSTHAKTTANSGATEFQKGDLLTENHSILDENSWLYECKTKMSPSKLFSLKKEWFEKNEQEKMFMNKQFSAVVFNFGPDQKNYYVLDEKTFLLLRDAYNRLNSDGD